MSFPLALRPAFSSLPRLMVLAAGCVSLVAAAEFHVAPNGSSAGNGSSSSPWNLATALAHPSVVRAGDTIWLRGGNYRGAFTSQLRGSSAAPIIVRAVPGERVTIDGAPSADAALTLNGEHTWYWGFEVTNSSTAPRVDTKSNFNLRPYALTALGPNLKLINLVVHDAGNGIGLWSTSVNTEVYGCYVYYNGWSDPNRGHGEGIYMQNSTGVKRLVDNVVFRQFDNAIQAYGSSNAKVDNVYYEGNVLFANGELTTDPNGWGFLIGGGTIVNNHTLISNFMYNKFNYRRSNNMDIAYGKGSNNVTIRDNYSAGYAAINHERPVSDLTATGNTFIGAASAVATSQISASSNTFLSTPPAANRIFVRRNQYDKDRATVIVYNWAGSTNVNADLGGLLGSGDRYEVRKIENYFASPVVSGSYSSGAITLPMNNYEVAAPAGSVPTYPTTSFPTFGVFEVRKITAPAASVPAAPAPAPAPTPTPTQEPAPGLESGPALEPPPAYTPDPIPAPAPSEGSPANTLPAISVSSGALKFTYKGGGNVTLSQPLTVSSTSAIAFTVAASGGSWLSVNSNMGTTPASLSASVNPAGLSPGTYNGTIRITAPGAGNGWQNVLVTLLIEGAAPSLTGVLSGASFSENAFAPGSLVSIFGRNLGSKKGVTMNIKADKSVDTVLADCRVLFDGHPAPLLFVQEGQINTTIPFEVAGRSKTRAQLECGGKQYNALDLPLAEAAPALFTSSASGHGQGAILNQDGKINSGDNPAANGSVVVLYGTGGGAFDRPVQTGKVSGADLARLALAASVSVDGMAGEVLYAGSAPGMVAGVIQVNVRLPKQIRSGNVPVVLKVGRFSSQAALTLAVK